MVINIYMFEELFYHLSFSDIKSHFRLNFTHRTFEAINSHVRFDFKPDKCHIAMRKSVLNTFIQKCKHFLLLLLLFLQDSRHSRWDLRHGQELVQPPGPVRHPHGHLGRREFWWDWSIFPSVFAQSQCCLDYSIKVIQLLITDYTY